MNRRTSILQAAAMPAVVLAIILSMLAFRRSPPSPEPAGQALSSPDRRSATPPIPGRGPPPAARTKPPSLLNEWGDLSLDPGVASKIADSIEDCRRRIPSGRPSSPLGAFTEKIPGSDDTYAVRMYFLRRELEERIRAILTPEQWERFRNLVPDPLLLNS